MEEEVFSPPPVAARFRKDSFRIVQVLDSPYRIADDTIDEADELAQPALKSRQTRLGSLDANAGHPSMMMMNIKQHPTIMRSSSVHSKKHSRENSGTAWKQLNDGLNNLFPGKKSSNPSLPEMQQLITAGTGSRTAATTVVGPPGGNGGGPQNRPTSPCVVVRELRKSASRSSLISSDYEYMSEDEQIYLHTIHGGGRINTLTSSRHLEPFSKITRRRSGEDPNIADNINNIAGLELNAGVRSKHGG